MKQGFFPIFITLFKHISDTIEMSEIAERIDLLKAIRIYETGRPEVMRLEDVEKPVPQASEVLIKIAAASIAALPSARRRGKSCYLCNRLDIVIP